MASSKEYLDYIPSLFQYNALLLHKLTEYRKQQDGLLNKSVVRGYDKYLKNHNIEIGITIPAAEKLDELPTEDSDESSLEDDELAEE